MRVAFQLYEHEDMLGLAIDEHILLRTLKVSPCSFSLHKQLIFSWKYVCVCISRLLKLHFESKLDLQQYIGIGDKCR